MSSIDITTPERVGVELPIAGIGYRSLAYLVDVTIILTFWVLLYFAYALTGPDVLKVVGGMSTFARVAATVGVFFFQWIYWTLSEVLWRGQTPGKRLLKIRVVRADGSAVGVFESAVRNLLRLVDFLPFAYGAGIITMLIDAKHRRLGDLAAGTVALREEQVALDKYAVSEAPVAIGRVLSPAEHEIVRSFAQRLNDFTAERRLELARLMAQRFGDEVPADEPAVRAWVAKRTS